jgi:hypothetical protein
MRGGGRSTLTKSIADGHGVTLGHADHVLYRSWRVDESKREGLTRHPEVSVSGDQHCGPDNCELPTVCLGCQPQGGHVIVHQVAVDPTQDKAISQATS